MKPPTQTQLAMQAYRLYTAGGATQQEAADRFGVDRNMVRRIKEMTVHGVLVRVLTAMEDGRVTLMEGARIARQPLEVQNAALETALEGENPGAVHRLSVRQIRTASP